MSNYQKLDIERWTAERVRERIDKPTNPLFSDIAEEEKEKDRRPRADASPQSTLPRDPFTRRQFTL